MAEHDLPSDDPRLSAAARHALHDEEVVAAYAVDGDAADDPARASALIERCTTCRDLHADLVAIGATIRAAGTAAAVAAVRPAPQDFRLTASDAVRLRGGNALQRWAARFLDGLASFGRPVGATLATLGVVGVLVGTMGIGQLRLAPMAGSPASGGAAPGATFQIAENQAQQTPTTDRTDGLGPTTSRDETISKAPSADDTALAGGSSTPLVLAGSLLLLALGLAFVVAGTRRRRHMPVRRTTRG